MFLETRIPPILGDDATQAVKDAYEKYRSNNDTATFIMLATMTPELQKQHETMNALSMLVLLKEFFDAKPGVRGTNL